MIIPLMCPADELIHGVPGGRAHRRSIFMYKYKHFEYNKVKDTREHALGVIPELNRPDPLIWGNGALKGQ